jgi:hypothetical protein
MFYSSCYCILFDSSSSLVLHDFGLCIIDHDIDSFLVYGMGTDIFFDRSFKRSKVQTFNVRRSSLSVKSRKDFDPASGVTV